ncbi:hypothetical protein LSAT2_002382, partial [Lamellibrachia satsuma]
MTADTMPHELMAFKMRPRRLVTSAVEITRRRVIMALSRGKQMLKASIAPTKVRLQEILVQAQYLA